jgi:hypothetical protein
MRTGAVAWLVVAALATALAGVVRERAWADGAIAVGSTGNVVRDGIAFGMAVDVSKDAAGDIAVKRCRTFEAKVAAERCQVVATFSGECFAIAYDPKPGTPGAGWGIGPDQLAANRKAVAMCEQSAGPARKGYCQVERFGCDTTGPKPAAKPGAEGGQTDTAPEAPKPDAKPDAKPDTKPAPGVDARAIPDTQRAKDAREANASKEAKDAKEEATNTKPNATAEAPPPPVADPAPKAEVEPKIEAKPKAGPAETKGGSAAAPLLPVLALAGVGVAYAVGQHLRGRLKGGVAERQILTGSALAVAAAIAIKLLDMAGAGHTAAAALAGLIALGAALLA